jgi:methylenetetrahydrofolate dehydrogenase (NADP+)/methenyltetrahydrofolate cyclohydrolase
LTPAPAIAMFTAMPVILDGKKVSQAIYEKVLLELSLLPQIPKVVFVLVGEDPASQTYVGSKTKKCMDLGLRSETLKLAESTTEDELFSTVERLNKDRDVNGILVQLPLPRHISKMRILRAIDPLKDIDGLHPDNVGRLAQGDPRFVPCTPAGILEILKFYTIPLDGAKVVILGRSDIVGKPAALLMLSQNATVTVCHSHTKDLAKEMLAADVLIAALGQPKFVKASMVKEGATVVDVGIHRIDGKLCGDVDFDDVSTKASAISPVPGGVGPMTIAMLMKNLATAASFQFKK